ncbi:hypothetical protein BLNAU_20463 [Blattamonas nauphoetae]|uniref:SMODS-associating 2TM beta-strand rich effector domain-containing protein n=1 Tax=Blattamonas nauphoetae TaxID=2049346 RepID=A0ABQ9X2T2_9EUKA|nr:hypothetical protein BLNAU_20463 [Blattamonas nauphoetae]
MSSTGILPESLLSSHVFDFDDSKRQLTYHETNRSGRTYIMLLICGLLGIISSLISISSSFSADLWILSCFAIFFGVYYGAKAHSGSVTIDLSNSYAFFRRKDSIFSKLTCSTRKDVSVNIDSIVAIEPKRIVHRSNGTKLVSCRITLDYTHTGLTTNRVAFVSEGGFSRIADYAQLVYMWLTWRAEKHPEEKDAREEQITLLRCGIVTTMEYSVKHVSYKALTGQPQHSSTEVPFVSSLPPGSSLHLR